MKTPYIAVIGILFLASCSLTDPYPNGTWSDSTDTFSGTVWDTGSVSTDSDVPWNTGTSLSGMAGSGTAVGTASTTPLPDTVSVGTGETGDFSLKLVNGTGALRIRVGTDARANVRFDAATGMTLTASVRTPNDANGNVRISQIVMPDGTADGPFSQDMTYALAQSGQYRLVLGPNMMAGDPWTGDVDLNVSVR